MELEDESDDEEPNKFEENPVPEEDPNKLGVGDGDEPMGVEPPNVVEAAAAVDDAVPEPNPKEIAEEVELGLEKPRENGVDEEEEEDDENEEVVGNENPVPAM